MKKEVARSAGGFQKPPLKKEVARSAGGFVETNFKLEFVSLKSPVIALCAMPPSFSKRVFEPNLL
ncbi:MAG: hypothetical protein A3D15_00270 [Alphaproteobacteria bacterium RIFCSPHIGHO2_02_FULL_40_34]|nr:MAG: hypothetical protein A3D15_00270 [Alphaproteobacteria bacterium RIFCSPHIGHO2_02_FULL_40_34]